MAINRPTLDLVHGMRIQLNEALDSVSQDLVFRLGPRLERARRRMGHRPGRARDHVEGPEVPQPRP
jgi:hypothetical protein